MFFGVGGVRIGSAGGTRGDFSVAFVANAVTSFWLRNCAVSVDDGGAPGRSPSGAGLQPRLVVGWRGR